MDLQQLTRDPAAFREIVKIPTPAGPRPVAAVAADFQRRDFEALDGVLLHLAGQDVGDRDVFRRAWIERTKGGSKDTDAAVSALWLLAFSPRPLSLQIGGGDKDQAKLIKAAADDILRLNTWLRKVIDSQVWKLVNKRTGSELEILAHDVGGSHGARPDALWLNELAHFKTREFADVLLSNVAKKPGAFLCVCTNAGFRDSFVWPMREEAETSPRWYFSVITTPAPWTAPEDIEEERRLKPPQMFNRLWRGIWSDGSGDFLTDEIDNAITLAEPFDATSPGWAFYGGLDIGTRHDATALTIVGKHVGHVEEVEHETQLSDREKMLIEAGIIDPPDDEVDDIYHPATGRIKLAAVRTWKPAGGKVDLTAVEREIVRINKQLPLSGLAADPWQAELMTQRLQQAGVPVEGVNFSGPNLQAMATATMDVFRESLIELFDHGDLVADLRRLRIVERSYGFRLESPRMKHDGEIQGTRHGDCATALSLALLMARRWSNVTHTVSGDLVYS